MKKLLLPIVMVGAMLLPNAGRADVAFQPTLGLDQPAGNLSGDPISNGTYALIADLNSNGWGGNDYLSQASTGDNSSSWLWDNNDLLLDVGQISGGTAFPNVTLTGNPGTNVPGYDAGADNYYILWFDKAFDPLAAGPGSGVNYGAELLGKVGADGFTLTPDAVGGAATLHTLGATPVPEPVSSVLALLGGGAMAFRRRFNRVKTA